MAHNARRCGSIVVFGGAANLSLAKRIADTLDLPLGDCTLGKFSNGETNVIINESVRANDIFVVQPTCSPSPNDYLVELFIMIDGLRRGSAGRITAVLPFYGYSTHEKRTKERTPITAKLIANLIMEAGADRIMTLDLHAPQIQGFFDIPVDLLYAENLFANYLQHYVKAEMVFIAPKTGCVKLAKELADQLSTDMAFLQRNLKTNEVSLIGSVEGKVAVIVADIADTCENLRIAAHMAKEGGAIIAVILATHGILSDPGIANINSISNLHSLVVTNSCPWEEKVKSVPRLVVLDVAPMFAESIRRTHNGESISSLFHKRAVNKGKVLYAPPDHTSIEADGSLLPVPAVVQ